MVRVSVIVFLGPVARAEQVEPGDTPVLAGVGVGLLLNGEPARAEPLRPEPEPPAQVQAATDLADGGLDDLEVPGVAEPLREPACDFFGTGPLPEAPGQQRPEPDVGGDRVAEPGEVLSGQALEEQPGECELRHRSSRAAVRRCCGHGSFVRAWTPISVLGNPPT